MRERLGWLSCVVALLLAISSALPTAYAAPREKHARSKRPSASAARAERLGLGTRAAAAKLLMGQISARWSRAAGSSFPGTLRHPVSKGWFVRGFGSGEGGYHQAIDIGGEVGWNVRAAADGIVGYVGDELDGMGNAVFIVHAGGLATLYAHNSKLLVAAGQRVSRGHVVAELGSTGRSKGPHVHFELLYDGKNCDPTPLFRPSLRLRNHKRIGTQTAVWRMGKKPPKAVACRPRKHHPGYEHSDDEPSAGLEQPAPAE